MRKPIMYVSKSAAGCLAALPLLLAILVPNVRTGSVQADQPAADKPYDVLIRGGQVYDGSGDPPKRVDVAIRGDKIVAVASLPQATAKTVVDAENLAVAPGFINMLSWSNESL